MMGLAVHNALKMRQGLKALPGSNPGFRTIKSIHFYNQGFYEIRLQKVQRWKS